ncbi:MAG: glutaredoxin family protein [bacterium]|nr:glutaredoxin family protein [bacterium]
MAENNTPIQGGKKVAIYTTPTCGYCKMAKEFFKENNVAYEEYNVATDAEKRNEMVEMTGQLGVPVITIDDNAIVGFNKPKMIELLGL